MIGVFQQRAEDGSISDEDRAAVRKEGYEAISAIMSFLEGLDVQAGEGK